MDPMEYIMDEPTSPQQNTTSRCPYMQNQQSLPQINTFMSPPRDAHRYDPVHNTDSWFRPNTGPQIPSHVSPPSMPHWNSGYASHNWQGFGESHTSVARPELSSFRSQGGYTGRPPSIWPGPQGYDSISFGHNPFLNVANRSNPSHEHSPGRNSAPASATSGAATQTPARFPNLAMQPFLTNLPGRLRPNGTSHSSSESSRLRDPYGGLPTNMDQTTSSTRPSTRTAPQSNSYQQARRRRITIAPMPDDVAFNSDDDESGSDLEAEYRRSSEFIHPDGERERFLAFARGRLASGKRVTSKDALSSLEKVDVKDLTEADRSCIICYNDFGVQNPEGVVEEPLRLPRCKHIFGDKCIKKWFEDSDSCPYCRDKLPSELAVTRAAALEALRIREQRLSAAHRARTGLAGRLPTPDDFIRGLIAEQRLEAEDQQYRVGSGNIPPVTTYSSPSPNRLALAESPENRRRRQRRAIDSGRLTMHYGRPVSMGSSRFLTPNQPNAQRAHSQGFGAVTHGPAWDLSARSGGGGIAPGTDNETPSNHGSASNGLSSTEEASPAVAVGSNINSAHNYRSPLDEVSPHWSDQFGSYLNQAHAHSNSGVLPPPRSEDRSRGLPFEVGSAVESPTNHQSYQHPFTAFDPTRSYHSIQNGMNPDPDAPARWSR